MTNNNLWKYPSGTKHNTGIIDDIGSIQKMMDSAFSSFNRTQTALDNAGQRSSDSHTSTSPLLRLHFTGCPSKYSSIGASSPAYFCK